MFCLQGPGKNLDPHARATPKSRRIAATHALVGWCPIMIILCRSCTTISRLNVCFTCNVLQREIPTFLHRVGGGRPSGKMWLESANQRSCDRKIRSLARFRSIRFVSRSCAAIADQARREASARVIKATMVAMVASGYNDSIRRSNVN